MGKNNELLREIDNRLENVKEDLNSQKLYSTAMDYFNNAKLDDSLKVFLQILELHPADFEANSKSAVIYFQQNNFKESARYSLNAFKVKHKDRSNIIVLAKSLIEVSLFEQAKLIIQSYLNDIPVDEELNNLLAKTNSRTNNHPKKEDIPLRTSVQSENTLKILFIQDSPCIRNYKYAAALRKRGHKVTLAYFEKKLSERYNGMSDDVYDNSIKITDFKQLWEISKNYDLIHSHNEPDYYTVAAMAGSIPVIHDTHDLISLRSPENSQLKYFEGVANRGAAGRIYSTPYQYKEAQDLYGVNGNSLVFYNYASENHLPKKFLPKLSDVDGKIHLVYEGGVSGTNGKHRDFADQFVELAYLGYMVHIYPASFNDELNNFFKQYPNIIYNKPVSPDTLIEAMTQFDFGIIPWNMEKGNVRFLSSTIANKLFEYLAAGLPVAAADITSYRDFFQKNPVGITFSSIEDFHSKIDNLLKIKSEMKGKKIEFTYENEIEKVEEFYFKILNKQKDEKKEIIFESETRQKNNLNKNENLISSSFKKLEAWIDENGWEGYDPYDIEDFIMSKKKSGELSESDANRVKQYNEVDPFLCREKLKIEKKTNAKALGLLLSSYSNLYLVFNDDKYLTKAEEIANWLMKNRSAGYFKFCWGYPFDWQSKIFIPKGTPSVVVSTIVGDGFWRLYQVTKKEIYLEVCISICEFITEDLNCDIIDEDKICFSYTPLDDFHVHNANLFAGEFLARIGKEISNNEWIEAGVKTANYAISEQNGDGSIFYWGKIQDSFSPKHLDSYHSGFEIRSLINLYSHTGRIEINVAAEKYLGFYLKNYIQTDGSTRQFALQKNNSQINIHGVAETILLLSSLVKENSELKSTLEKCINWTVNNLQHEKGWFGYMIKDEHKIMIPYLRWGEAWMMRGLSEYYLSKTNYVDIYTTKFYKFKKFEQKTEFRPQSESKILLEEKTNFSSFNQIKKTRAKKILHFGGAHTTHLRDLMSEMNGKGFKQSIVTYTTQKSKLSEEYPSYYLDYIISDQNHFNLTDFSKYSFLKKEINKILSIEKPDAIHVHSLNASLPVKIIREHSSIPIFLTPWNMLRYYNQCGVTYELENEAISLIDKFIVPLKTAFTKYKSLYKSLKDEQWIQSGYIINIDKEFKRNLQNKGLKILSARQVDVKYNQHLLIESIPTLIKKFPQIQVTLLRGTSTKQGSQYYNLIIELINKLNLSKYIKIIDKTLGFDDFYWEIKNHDIIYSIYELDMGYSVTNILGITSGAAVVSDNSPIKDMPIFQNGRNIFKTEINQSSIKDTIISIGNDLPDALEKVHSNNNAFFVFDKEILVNELYNAYEEVFS